MTSTLDRPALYYPYIHIRDEDWLKATLLSFGQVRRIVPPEFKLNDSPGVRRFRDLTNARGEPLVADEPAYHASVWSAQERLTRRLSDVSPDALQRFTHASTEVEFNGDLQRFQMHRGKLDMLLDFFLSRGLAWPARGVTNQNEATWFAMHPKLGEAVMSVIAIAIATEKGLDIVTNEGAVHRALAVLDEDVVLSEVAGLPTPPRRPDANVQPNAADDLVHLVMLTSLDVSRLTADQVAELVKDGKDLREFRAEVARVAQSVPDIPDPVERMKRLSVLTDEVIEKWEAQRRKWPTFALDAVLSAADYKQPAFVASLIGASSFALASAGVGLSIALATYAGMGIWRGFKEQASSPYQYLSRIHKAGAVLATPRTSRIEGAAR